MMPQSPLALLLLAPLWLAESHHHPAASVTSISAGAYINSQNIDSPDFSAGAQSGTASGVQSHVLSATFKMFTFVPIGASAFAVKATGIRHVQPTFRVTDNTGLALNTYRSAGETCSAA